MTLSLITFLIVCPLAFLAGLVDAVAGGGGLISLPAFMIAGLPAHLAIGTNKMMSSMGTTVATIRYGMSGFIKWSLALPAAVVALLASHLGANAALAIDETVFTAIMLVLLPIIAIYLLVPKKPVEEKEAYSKSKTTALAMGIAAVVGFYDGLYGPGTGTFLILGLTALAHMPITHANGTTKVINLTTNISALVVFLTNGTVILALGLTAGAFNIAGNLLGAHLFTQNGSKIAKPIMLIVLAIFFVRTLLSLLGIWG